jgi:hypothetical protein
MFVAVRMDRGNTPENRGSPRTVRSVSERELAITLVLLLAQKSDGKFSPMAFYDDDMDFMEDLAYKLNVPNSTSFKNKVVKVCRHLVSFGVLYARIARTAKEYIDEPNRQQNYMLRPGKVHLLREERRPGVTYGPQGEAEWLLRHAYPAN